jgi:translocation and assembly module TamB
MTRRRARLLRFGVAGALLLTVAAATLLVTLRSQWFRDRVREKIVSVVETATGARAEIGAFQFDWSRLRAQVGAFTLHGTEPADRAPLFHASSITVGLKIVSLWKRDIDIASLEVLDPQVNLIIGETGATNVPAPKIPARGTRNPIEAILNLAVGEFNFRNGTFTIESRGRAPFDARGRNLNLRLLYEAAAPRYRGRLAVQPLEAHFGSYAPIPFGVELALLLERNRIEVDGGRITTGDTEFAFSGALENLAAPHATLRYDARVSMADLSRILRLKGLESGTALLKGEARWAGGAEFVSTGTLSASAVVYRDSTVRIRGNLEGPYHFRPERAVLAGARVRGTFGGPGACRPGTVWNCSSSPVEGRIEEIVQRGRDLDLDGIAMSALGGSFSGNATLRDLNRYNVKGQIAGVEGRRTVALYSSQPLPWNATASGPVLLTGSLRRKEDLQLSGELEIAPAPDSAPVSGRVTATYEARGKTLDLGRSAITLPASRASVSGVVGSELRVHFETRDLGDVLPALGQDPAAFPVRLAGTAAFDGTVTGNLLIPRIEGRLRAGGFSVSGTPVDSFEGSVTAAPDSVRVRDATAVRGAVRAQFQGIVALSDWKPTAASQIYGDGSIRNAPVAELAQLFKAGNLPVTGSVTATGQFSGTLERPLLEAGLEVTNGLIRGEPFDRFSGRAYYANRTISLTSGEWAAGTRQVHIGASYQHSPSAFDSGRLRFQLSSGVIPLDQIVTLRESRPGVRGTAQLTASGEVEIAPGSAPRIEEFHADLVARSLQLTGQPLGDAHLTAQSEGRVLRARLDAGFANSTLRGTGEWRLDGDYPGSATISFSRLDFAQLRAWVAPETAERLSGWAEGELRLEGPALKPEAIRAALILPRLELGFAPGQGISGSVALTNSGPVSATLAGSVITISAARLVGRSTDISFGGRINLADRRPLDVTVNGRLDLGIVDQWDPDFSATGVVTTNARILGAPSDLQIDGRLQFQNASLSLADFPNGISNANGTVVFTRDRASIQNLSGETGGGKITLSGFVGYGEGPPVFRIVARAEQVRVRYPEGVSTVADSDLHLTGTLDRSTLSGTVTVLRTGFNPQSDFSSIIAKSAEPVRTPSARTGFLGGLNFDVQINTDPDIEFQSSLTQDIQVEARLSLRGTPTNPAVVGRVNVTQGQVLFYGTRYTINQGSIAFYNPLKIEPVLDVDLETKARGIDVTLSVTGPLNKLNLTPRSDPPLQFSEIVALLATGRTPTSDPTLLAQQSTAPQSWQQMGASALLGQAIASPVAGRLQRFFGVSKLRIDPTLPGVGTNPQARLTLEQQVTPDLTFTYITNVTNSNPQVIRVEWAVSKQWSVVALREENGVFGLDFFFKRRF